MNNHSVPVKAARADWFLLVLLGLSLVLNILLGSVVARFALTPAATAQAQAAPETPAIGEVLPAFDAERAGGPRERIEFSSSARPTLIYVFKPDCVWCDRNMDNVQQLLTVVQQTHRVLLLSLGTEIESYRGVLPADLPIYIRPAPRLYKPYRLGPTPLTLVVSPEGTVIRSWVGAFSGANKAAVEAHFGIRLPGLTTGKSPQPAGN